MIDAGHRQLQKIFASDFNVFQTYEIYPVLWLKVQFEIIQFLKKFIYPHVLVGHKCNMN